MTSLWLTRALEESRARGFLGPGAVEPQITHAGGFVDAWNAHRADPPTTILDLGSGGGLPGLVLLDTWAHPTTFLDSMEKRTNFLLEVLSWDDVPSGGSVWRGRAEVLARETRSDSRFSLVTARSFGPPSVTAECAVRFLHIGGLVIVSEPPEGSDRWSDPGLDQLGLVSRGTFRTSAGYKVMEKIRPTPLRFPRATGTPGKNPLF